MTSLSPGPVEAPHAGATSYVYLYI
jgi:hypothetical protein